jgi:chemotaxis protein CheX
MNTNLTDTLSRVAEEVFESLAFVLPAFEEDESGPPTGTPKTAGSITFTGPFEGTLSVSVSNELLSAVAANMLGFDFGEVPSEDTQRDAFKELLNVICGNLLPALAGEDAVFDVGAAELIADGAVLEDVSGRPAIAGAKLHLEEGWAELVLFTPSCVAAGAEAPN